MHHQTRQGGGKGGGALLEPLFTTIFITIYNYLPLVTMGPLALAILEIQNRPGRAPAWTGGVLQTTIPAQPGAGLRAFYLLLFAP